MRFLKRLEFEAFKNLNLYDMQYFIFLDQIINLIFFKE